MFHDHLLFDCMQTGWNVLRQGRLLRWAGIRWRSFWVVFVAGANKQDPQAEAPGQQIHGDIVGNDAQTPDPNLATENSIVQNESVRHPVQPHLRALPLDEASSLLSTLKTDIFTVNGLRVKALDQPLQFEVREVCVLVCRRA